MPLVIIVHLAYTADEGLTVNSSKVIPLFVLIGVTKFNSPSEKLVICPIIEFAPTLIYSNVVVGDTFDISTKAYNSARSAV